MGGELVYDDDHFIVKNIYIRNLANIPSFFLNRSAATFGGLSEDIYRPLATFSYALDYFFWTLNPFGYHQPVAVRKIIHARICNRAAGDFYYYF